MEKVGAHGDEAGAVRAGEVPLDAVERGIDVAEVGETFPPAGVADGDALGFVTLEEFETAAELDDAVRDQLASFEAMGYGKLPVCIAKTQYSFSTNPDLKGAPDDHTIPVREVRLSAGAEFVVAICGDVMTMPGLPKVPAADSIDVGADGKIVGLF